MSAVKRWGGGGAREECDTCGGGGKKKHKMSKRNGYGHVRSRGWLDKGTVNLPAYLRTFFAYTKVSWPPVTTEIDRVKLDHYGEIEIGGGTG